MRYFLWKMICEDLQVLQKSGTKIKRLFTLSGIIMSFNCAITLLGMFMIFEIIFTNSLIAALLSIFTTSVFINIYRLCLTTLQKKEKNFSLSYSLSLMGRLLFVGFFGLLVIKGLELFMALTVFKILDVHDYNGQILLSIKEMHSQIPPIWVSTFALLMVFIFPFLIKVSIGVKNRYYMEKKIIEDGIIKADYFNFKKEYSSIFLDHLNLLLEFKENFTDPPFNTHRKTEVKKIGNNNDFLKSIFTEGDN